MKTAIVTDSNSGITQDMSKQLGIFTIPMPVLINGEQYLEDISLTQEQFYEKLKDDTAQVSTSQPSEAKNSTRFSVVVSPEPVPPEQMSTISASIAAAAIKMNTALLLLNFDFVTGHPSRLSIL